MSLLLFAWASRPCHERGKTIQGKRGLFIRDRRKTKRFLMQLPRYLRRFACIPADAKSQHAAGGMRMGVATGAGIAKRRRAGPRAAAKDALGSSIRALRIVSCTSGVVRRSVPIGAPLRHVAQHVMQAPVIGFFCPTGLGAR